jgi:hypothetical protein
MATWKKVHVDSANTTHGTITATLGDIATAIGGSTSLELVVSDGNSGGENELKTRSITFGANAFTDTAIPTVNDTNIDIIAGAGLTGTGAFTTNDSDAVDITLAVDIPNTTLLNEAAASDDEVLVYDTSESALRSVTVSNLVSNVTGVNNNTITISAGTNLGTGGSFTTNAASDATVTLNLDTTLEDMIGLNFANSAATGIGVDPSSGTDTAGAGLNIHAGQGTGTGAGGSITFQVADGGAVSGSGANALATALTIADDKTVTAAGNVVVTGDLTVNGATTTVSTTNLLVEDVFIRLASEAAADADTGIIFGGSAQKVFGWDNGTESGRFGVAYSGGDAAETDGFANGEDFDGYMSVVHSASGAAAQVSAFGQLGNIYVDTSNQDIYIYS